MTRVLVFGASHVAQVKTAFSRGQTRGDVPATTRMDFISAPGPVSACLKVEGTYLRLLDQPMVPLSNRTHPERFQEWHRRSKARFDALSGPAGIDLSGYDLVVYLGGNLTRHWLSIDHNLRQNAYSQASLTTACDDILQSIIFSKVLSHDAAQGVASKVVTLMEPLWNEIAPDYQAKKAELGPLHPRKTC